MAIKLIDAELAREAEGGKRELMSELVERVKETERQMTEPAKPVGPLGKMLGIETQIP